MLHEPGNILFSPSSLHICTALVQLAAEGDTLHDIARTLHLPQDQFKVRKIYKDATEKIKRTQKNILTSANKVFVKDDFDISQEFAQIANDTFDAGSYIMYFTYHFYQVHTHGKMRKSLIPL